jgi:hypothetical protein
MSHRIRRFAAVLAVALAAALLPSAAIAAGGTIVKVNQTDLGGHWSLQTLADGTGSFVTGPSTPPYGTGSFEMTTSTVDGKATLFTDLWTGRPLSDITGLDYWTYRDASSTSPSYVAPSINIAIWTNADGPGTGFATAVFEPLYAFGNDAIHDGEWQDWDTFAPSQTGFAGGWWVTRQVGTLCPQACYADFATILANAPDATILAVGLNVGRGPASFVGAVDGLSLTASEGTTTYDFENLAQTKDGCKNGGWQDFHNPVYKNQGQCVSFYASANRQGPKADPSAAKAERRAAKATTHHAKAATHPAKATTRASSTHAATKHGKGKAAKSHGGPKNK